MKSISPWLARTLACLFLSACSTLGDLPAPPPRPAGEAIPRFSLEGRLSVRQGEKSYQAGIQWQHDPDQDKILLSGPLGQGLAELEQTAAGARLTTADQKVITAADGDSLARELLGFDLPLSALPAWVTGREQAVSGWKVSILRYESNAANALPQLLELQRDELLVRIKIDEWRLP